MRGECDDELLNRRDRNFGVEEEICVWLERNMGSIVVLC